MSIRVKLQVSFAQEPYTRDDILQKRPLYKSADFINKSALFVRPSHIQNGHTQTVSIQRMFINKQYSSVNFKRFFQFPLTPK